MWCIWNARNKRIFENICLEPDEVVKRSKDLCTDFSTSKLQLRLSIPSPISKCVCGKKPDIGWRKLNRDASFNVDADSGCGFIIRDSCASVELLGPGGIGVVPDAEYAEAIAIREGIQCAVSRGMNRLVVESDSLSLISKLRSHRPWKGPLGRQLNAIRKLGTRIAELHRSHTRRDGNRVAHSLARLGLNQSVVSSVVAMFLDVVQSLIVN